MRQSCAILLLVALTACGGSNDSVRYQPEPQQGTYKVGKPYQIDGQWYYPEYDPAYDQRGIASWYGSAFHGKLTANGEVFDRHLVSAAHTTLPLPSIVEVTNLDNGRRIALRVNDRGPFVGDRIIDLSEAAAIELGFRKQGLANVRVRFLEIAQDAEGSPPKPIAVAGAPPATPPPQAPQTSQTKTVATAEPARTAASICASHQHFVQVVALTDPSRANRVAERIGGLGPVWRETLHPSTGALHRVRIGPLSERRLAFDVLSRVKQMGYQDAYVADCSRLSS